MAERSLYFGLGSNVQFFASRQGFAKLSTRIKSLSMLYDRLLFQPGVYEATVGENGTMSGRGPVLSRDQLRPLRNRRGASFTVLIGRTGTSERIPMIATNTVQVYRAQFVSLMEEMAVAKPDWVAMDEIEPAGARAANDVAEHWTEAEQDLIAGLLPDVPRRLRDLVHKTLNVDLASASLMGMHLAPGGLHHGILVAKATEGRAELVATGERTLQVMLPQLATATWEDVRELRKDRGLASLRA